MRLRAVSWNVHSWVGTDRREDPERIADVLSALQADVVGLQEVDWRTSRPEDRDPLELVAERLGMTAIPGPNLVDHRGEYGNGLLTRLPVETVERFDLSQPGREPRGVIDARLRRGERSVRVLVTHLGLDRVERRSQLGQLAERLAPTTEPEECRLLLGDLNEWLPWRRSHAPLLPRHFARSYSARSFPTRLPLFHLDRILVAPTPRLARFEAHRDGIARRASDHLPLVLDAEWS